jgi:thiol-disulfide isomerase/thioredoxin
MAAVWLTPRAGALAPDQPKPGAPTDAKARKTFAEAIEWREKGYTAIAIDTFRKANQQDGGHCTLCLRQAYVLAQQMNDYKSEEGILREWIPLVRADSSKATLHFQFGIALQRDGMAERGARKSVCFTESCDEFRTALQFDPSLATAHYGLGISLANLHQDDAARAEFTTFLGQNSAEPGLQERATRYVDHVELARARMAPPFALTTLDGQQISLDSLAGKVVLIDFWATWCGPCREALPHIRQIAQEFAGQPFVVLSVSLDDSNHEWREFVAKNGMTWLQYRDGGFKGPMATRFGVSEIPATFSIDGDGVLEDESVGDANIEGKLKKMIEHAVAIANQKSASATADPGSGSQN